MTASTRFRLGNLNADARVDRLWGRPDNPWTGRGARGASPSVFGNAYLQRGATDPDGTVYP